MGVDLSQVKVGTLYKIYAIPCLYIERYDPLTESNITPIYNNVDDYNGAIFLYLGLYEHEDATDGWFHKFFYNNEIYYTETADRFACTFEEVII